MIMKYAGLTIVMLESIVCIQVMLESLTRSSLFTYFNHCLFFSPSVQGDVWGSFMSHPDSTLSSSPDTASGADMRGPSGARAPAPLPSLAKAFLWPRKTPLKPSLLFHNSFSIVIFTSADHFVYISTIVNISNWTESSYYFHAYNRVVVVLVFPPIMSVHSPAQEGFPWASYSKEIWCLSQGPVPSMHLLDG